MCFFPHGRPLDRSENDVDTLLAFVCTQSISFFQKLEAPLLRQLCIHLRLVCSEGSESVACYDRLTRVHLDREQVEFEKNEVVCRQGEMGDAFYVILHG